MRHLNIISGGLGFLLYNTKGSPVYPKLIVSKNPNPKIPVLQIGPATDDFHCFEHVFLGVDYSNAIKIKLDENAVGILIKKLVSEEKIIEIKSKDGNK